MYVRAARAPLGHRNVRIVSPDGRELRTVDIDSERGPLIRWAFEAYVTGNWTIRRLLAELETWGLTALRRVARHWHSSLPRVGRHRQAGSGGSGENAP